MSKLNIAYDPSVPKYTMFYKSGPAASPEQHEAEHKKYFRILYEQLGRWGVDPDKVQLEVTRLPLSQEEVATPTPVPVPRPITEPS